MKHKVYADVYNSSFDINVVLWKYFNDITKKVGHGDVVLIKPNMFMAEKGYYSNPELITAVAKYFKDFGAKVIVAERLMALYQIFNTSHEINKYAYVTSLDEVPTVKIKIENALSLRQEINVPTLILECDFLVGMPQFRTHASVLMSNALKNMVGILPSYTTRIVHSVGLTEAIVDLNRIRKQDLIVSDLVGTIEGNYPIKGTPMIRDLVIIGDNAVAVDSVAAELSGFNQAEIGYLQLAMDNNMGSLLFKDINLLNDINKLKFNCIKSENQIGRKNIKIIDDNEALCSECKRFCISLANFLEEELNSDDEITIAWGNNLSIQDIKNTKENLILVGNCSYMFRKHGIYIDGCPPRAIQATALLEWLKNNGDVSIDIINQCRWSNKN